MKTTANKTITFTIFFIIFSSKLFCQFTFTGAIIDENKEAIPFSVITLTNEFHTFKDTTHIDGKFKFSNIPEASYACNVSYLGYLTDTILNYPIEKNSEDTFQIFPDPTPIEKRNGDWRYKIPIKIFTSTDSMVYKIKIWGFVKYFSKHTKQIDTDLILLINNKLSVNNFIDKYYFVQKKPKKTAKVDIDLCQVNHYWINTYRFLDNDMQNKLWRMSKNRINNLNYEFKHLNVKNNKKQYPKRTYTDLEDINYNNSIIGIARLWNYLNYYYPHICQLKNWDGVLKKALTFVVDFNAYTDYSNALKHIANETKDDHSYFEFIKNNPIIRYPNTLAVNFKSIENKLVITKVFKENYALKINDTILQINNKTPVENKDFFVSKELKLETSPIRLLADSNMISIKRNDEFLNIALTKNDLMSGKKLFLINWYTKDSMNFEAYNTLRPLQNPRVTFSIFNFQFLINLGL